MLGLLRKDGMQENFLNAPRVSGCGWLGNATVWRVWVLGGDGVAAAVTEKWSVAARCVKPKTGRDGAGGFAVWVFGRLDQRSGPFWGRLGCVHGERVDGSSRGWRREGAAVVRRRPRRSILTANGGLLCGTGKAKALPAKALHEGFC